MTKPPTAEQRRKTIEKFIRDEYNTTLTPRVRTVIEHEVRAAAETARDQGEEDGYCQGLRRAAKECENVWHQGADRTRQNKLSHGCLASREAILRLAENHELASGAHKD